MSASFKGTQISLASCAKLTSRFEGRLVLRGVSTESIPRDRLSIGFAASSRNADLANPMRIRNPPANYVQPANPESNPRGMSLPWRARGKEKERANKKIQQQPRWRKYAGWKRIHDTVVRTQIAPVLASSKIKRLPCASGTERGRAQHQSRRFRRF